MVINLRSLDRKVFHHIWKRHAPSKDLHNRIQNRSNLDHRGVILQDMTGDCIRCVNQSEVAFHLFVHCDFEMQILRKEFG